MQSRSIFLLTAIFAATCALADDAWRWTDDDGVVHYSDVPVDGAEKVDIAAYSRTTGARISRPSPAANSSSDETQPPSQFRYESISIASPGAEETLWNIEGVLNVSVSVSPGLQDGHRLRAYFDGQERMVSGTNFTIDEVYRGVHNLQVEVIDATGKLMIRSQPNRFYVQQNMIKR
jgi:hypothetical protein